jgi:hypothetical protein
MPKRKSITITLHRLYGFAGCVRYPIEIHALFFMALCCALLMLKHDAEGKEMMERIVTRLTALSYHMRIYFWLDFQQLNTSTGSRQRSTHTRPSTSSMSTRSPSQTSSSTSCPPAVATSSATSTPPPLNELSMVHALQLRHHTRLARHARRHHGPHRRDAGQDMVPINRGT